MDVAMVQTINQKVFAFYRSDLKGYPEYFLENLYAKGYGLLALDVKAIEFASLHNLPYTIINDWLDTKTMLEIQDIAKDCENNWFESVRVEFTSHGVCWPEFDHSAMQWFWLDAIASLKLANSFRERGIEELLIVKQKNPTPVVFFDKGGGICKTIWEKELGGIIKIIEFKGASDTIDINSGVKNKFLCFHFKMNEFLYSLKRNSSLKKRLLIINNSITKITWYIISRFLSSISRVYVSSENLTGKIAFFASEIEISRSNDLLQDLTTTFPKNVVIIPHQMPRSGAYQTIKKWKIPIIKISENCKNELSLGNKFMGAYQDLIKTPPERTEDKILTALEFHFLYYCQYRWPMLDARFNEYLKNFSQYSPKIIIGAALNLAEWHLPILAAKRCGIKTISIPHGVVFTPETARGLLFDYYLYLNQISKEMLHQIAGINENKLIACKNCSDVNSHPTQIIKANFSSDSWKILGLFDNTTYMNPDAKYPLIYPSCKNPKVQMTAIKILNSPPDELKEKVSIKYKVHPYFSELELFNAVGGDILKNVLPPNTQLLPVLDETDLVIGGNYLGSAFVHAIINKKPFILFNNDEFFEKSATKGGFPLELFGNSITIVHTSEELWNLVMKFFTDPVVSAQMRLDVSLFSEQFLDNSHCPTISYVLEELLREKNDN
jgi:hypothetical protein